MRTAAHIIETVGKLVKKYDTRDPYELCKCLEIKIHFYNLEKKLKGFYYCNTTRCRMINKVMCGSLHTPSAIVCSIENLKVKLSEYYLQSGIANL